ncbi:hypothetical protein [Pyxidicoccus sp. MSG2]|uniref:hypothetical protein n=1 Tax=Pyxidicoccus sp. MSG2 TaxID=2996790 RepID=UPI00226DFE49|nr:hypothetical protein [Pyxidicoccus sp. MSG2]MCY1021202.1 hypothetical protein [Pyxidicoccus sp. MSG2]
MKLLGRDIPARELISRIEERLRTRGLPTSEPLEVPPEGVEPRVEPLTFNLHALEENADATRALPLHTHRGGAGQLVLVAKWAFRKSCQVFINEALGRQRVFNGHVRDSYAQLSAEVIRLRREVEELRARGSGGGRPPGDDRPVPAIAKAASEQPASVARESSAKPTAPAERAPRTVEAAAAVKHAPAPPSASAARAPLGSAPSSRPARTEAPSTRPSPRAKSSPASKSPPASRTQPTPTQAQVLPQPRHTRGAEGQQPRAQGGTPRARPETPGPSTGPAGQRPRKAGDKRRGRRK